MKEIQIKEIYDYHSEMVFNLCLNYLQNEHDAEEVTQDVFVKIFQQIDSFQQNSSLKTLCALWLNPNHTNSLPPTPAPAGPQSRAGLRRWRYLAVAVRTV